MTEKMITGGKLVVNTLERKGVKYIFTLSGGHIAAIYEHLIGSSIKVIDTRHEQAAVFMAEAYARLTGEVGVALVTAGPGLTNAVTGIANARLAHSPILLLSGRIGLKSEERLDLQEIEQLNVVSPLVKWSKLVSLPERIPEFIDTAMRHARSGSPGPTFIDMPVDILGKEVPESSVRFLDTPPLSKPAGNQEEIKTAVEMLSRAKRPIIIAGSGALYSRAHDEVRDLVEKTGIPLFTLSMGRGILPETHPLAFGPALVIRPGAAGSALTTADVVMLLGTRINLFTMFGNIFSADAKIIQVNIDQTEIGRNRNVALGIVGDVGVVSKQLTQSLSGAIEKNRFSEWADELRKQARFSLDSVMDATSSDKIPIHPQRLMKEIDEFIGEDGIVVADGGDTQVWMGMMRTSHHFGQYLDSGLLGCLGVGIPFANTAKLIFPQKRVLLVIGDGSLGFNFMELHTAVRHKLPIVVVVSNDLGWGMIRHSQTLKFGAGKNIATELGSVDYHRMIEVLGGYGEMVTNPADIKGALDRAFKSGKVSLINVFTDPDIISPGSYALASIAASAY